MESSMKTFFKVVALIELVLGGIFCIWEWFKFHDSYDGSTTELVVIIIRDFISICIFAGILFAISILLNNQEIMLSKLSAVQEATTGKKDDAVEAHEKLKSLENTKEAVPENMWKCPNCGKLNGNFTDSCACGTKKEEK